MHGHGESAADDITQDVVENDVGLIYLVGPLGFEQIQGGNDAPAGAAPARRRAAGFYADDAAVAGDGHLV